VALCTNPESWLNNFAALHPLGTAFESLVIKLVDHIEIRKVEAIP